MNNIIQTCSRKFNYCEVFGSKIKLEVCLQEGTFWVFPLICTQVPNRVIKMNEQHNSNFQVKIKPL